MPKPTLNAACSLLEQRATDDAEAILYRCEERSLSVGWLHQRVGQFADLYRDRGMAAGERLLIARPDEPETIAAFLGAMLQGLVPVLLDPLASLAAARFILDDCDATLVLAGAENAWAIAAQEAHRHWIDPAAADFANSLDALSPRWHPHPVTDAAPAFLLYTSGSTGRPKGVIHRHSDLRQTADTYARQVLGLQPGDRLLSASKLFFAFGLGNSLSFPLVTGAQAILNPAVSTPARILALIEHYRPSHLFAVPSLFARLLQALPEPGVLPGLRLCVSAGEALPASLLEQWRAWTGLAICDGLGSTEALHIFISNWPDQVRPGCAGRTVPGYETRLIDAQGAPVADGEVGHLEVRGPSLTPGYWNRPEQTARLLRGEGWLATGDLAIAEDGWITHLGRADDLFKSGGHWVVPGQVEEALREHPGVADCAVVGVQVLGLVRPKAFVIPVGQPAPTLADLRDHLRARLPEHLCPVDFEFRADLPRTDTGKLQRFQLRDPVAPPPAASSDATDH
ncbi:benzoate-CoA ligase family protein [Thiocystis minor]|uniref:benzoate-CoA ligase family protein n=1 Tax=Thiocystis minor TaxID=61597 RepID=UPI001911CB9E|nr:benzoate-CoA ligase family protein [Thiocystis minor]